MLAACSTDGYRGSTQPGARKVTGLPPGDEVVVSESCLVSALVGSKSDQLLPLLNFVRSMHSGIFACEHFYGGPVYFYGKLLPTGYGFALADRVRAHHLITASNIRKFFPQDAKGFSFAVNRQEIKIPPWALSLNVYNIQLQKKVFDVEIFSKTVGVLGITPLFHEGRTYTVFLWAYGPLNEHGAAFRFRKLIPYIYPPPGQTIAFR